MQRYGLRTKIHFWSGFLAWGLGIASASAGAVGSADLNAVAANVPGVVGQVAWFKLNAWWLAPLLALTTAVVVVSRQRMGEPWVWKAIHEYLDLCRKFVFSHRLGDPLDHHRVTLFRRHPSWHWPCCVTRPMGSKLMPVERSGHTTQRSSAAFLAPDQADKAEGVAGQAWRCWQTLIVPNLPDLSADKSDAAVSEYARKTWVTEAWVRARLAKGKTFAQSICAIPVRVHGDEWGVLVIDSRDPTSLEAAKTALYDLLGQSFAMLLERV